MVVHAANKDKPTLYWLHSLVTTVLAGFGGGIITPVILGARPSIIFANDLVIPVSCTVWYLTNYCGFDRVFSFKPVKLLWNVVVTLWRTNACINAVTLACTVIKPGMSFCGMLVLVEVGLWDELVFVIVYSSFYAYMSVLHTFTLTHLLLTLGLYYPSPVMGAIIGGTLINSLGAFVPFDKGITLSYCGYCCFFCFPFAR